MAKEIVRTRFAPSPTGYMHIGNLRTALFAWLIARSNDGRFILRIEDTDQEREVSGAVDVIYKTLAETGLYYDEGPDIGGEFGPYVQSLRKNEGIYDRFAAELLDKGAAYRCFCSKERLDLLRTECEREKRPIHYDGFCFHLRPEEVDARLANSMPYVVRYKMPNEGMSSFNDEVYGEIVVENSVLGDIVLVKSDGYPTYNFANVVDDHLMQITHVIRGMEYISSTPIYNHIYRAFGWERPIYVHVPPVMRDSQKKLSKRDGDASYADFIEKGCLKEALLNYIALLGWNPGNNMEKMDLAELVHSFNIKGICKSPAIFDEKKLRWLSGEYIRDLSYDEFKMLALPYISRVVKREDVNIDAIVNVLKKRTEFLTDILPQLDFIDQLPEYGLELFTNAKMKMTPQNSQVALQVLSKMLHSKVSWTGQEIYEAIIELAVQISLDKKILLAALRVALSGREHTPGGATDLAVILGKSDTLHRVGIAVERLKEKELKENGS